MRANGYIYTTQPNSAIHSYCIAKNIPRNDQIVRIKKILVFRVKEVVRLSSCFLKIGINGFLKNFSTFRVIL